MKPLSKPWAKKVIEASNSLVELYKEGEENKFSCPYCDLFLNYEGKCVSCPWVVFKGRECCECGGGEKDICYERTLPKNRLPRLRGWIRRCNNILDK